MFFAGGRWMHQTTYYFIEFSPDTTFSLTN